MKAALTTAKVKPTEDWYPSLWKLARRADGSHNNNHSTILTAALISKIFSYYYADIYKFISWLQIFF